MWKTTLYTGSLICIVAQLQHIAPKICVSETSRAYWELTRCGPSVKILNFPIFHFKAKPVKIEAKSRRVKKVNAGKGSRRKGTDEITKYLTGKPADTQSETRPTEQTKPLVQLSSPSPQSQPSPIQFQPK